MRKFFILTLMVASLMMVSCVERRTVVLDKFIPISADDGCEIKTGGDEYVTEGKIDLAFTSDYILAFQITNHIPSGEGSSSESSLTTAETNYFYVDRVEIEYEWDPRPQADGRKLTLDQKLWNKKTRKTEHAIVVDPNGGQAAGWVHIFEDAQAKNLLEHVNDIDWIASPLVIKIRVIGKLTDNTEIKTNKMNFNIIPSFGESVQMGSTYYIPEGGYPAPEEGNALSQEEYDAIIAQCAFSDSMLNGCLYGQDNAQLNCYAGDTAWERYIAETKCNLTEGSCYVPGYAAAGVVEIIYNSYRKPASDTGYYACCPGKAPEEPEKKEEDENAAAGE